MATDPREYFPTIGNYIPSLDDIQNMAATAKCTVVDIVKGRNNNSGLAVHTVTYMKFEEWTSHNQTHYYLIIGTSTGFQVFLLHDSRDREQQKVSSQQSSGNNLNAQTQSTNNPNIKNVASNPNNSPIINPLAPLINSSPHHSPSLGAVSSKRKKFHKKALTASDNLEIIKVAPGGGKQQRQINNPISCAVILKEPHKWEGPIIAVSPANEAHNFDSKCVRLYSLMEQQYVHVYRLRTRVHGILSRPNALVIVIEKEIVVINPMTDEKLYRKSCSPNPIHGVVATLGHRWLAFADTKLRQTSIATHILPRNNKNKLFPILHKLSSSCSPSKRHQKKKKKKKQKKQKKHHHHHHHKKKINKTSAHLSIYDSNDEQHIKNDDDDDNNNNNMEHGDKKNMNDNNNNNNINNNNNNIDIKNNGYDEDEFGGLGFENKGYNENCISSTNPYEIMTNQLYKTSDEISKRVQSTINTGYEVGMRFIQDSFVETRNEVKKHVKIQQENIKRKRDEMRQKTENESSINSYFRGNSNLYCDEPPKQGIISIIDILKGELLINFIAHDNAPLMHIAFDPSGTLLVTADCDGIYLNVFQVIGFPTINGNASSSSSRRHHDENITDDIDINIDTNNNRECTVYRHLYRIYRGFRYAIIRDITFSKDSRWMAICSARGTIHIYAINREGGIPSYKTHNLYEFGSTQTSNYLIDINKISDLQSIKKLHHDMKETRKDTMGSNTTTGGTKLVSTFSFLGQTSIGIQSLLVQTPIAFHQYAVESIGIDNNDDNISNNLTMDNKIKNKENMNMNMNKYDEINNKNLFLKIENLHKFTSRDLYNAQSVSYPYLHDQLYPQSTPTNTNQLNNNNNNQISSITMSIFNLDEQKQPILNNNNNNNNNKEENNNNNNNNKSSMFQSNYDEDTKRWLSHTELHPINRFHEVSLWGNPQFNFYSFHSFHSFQEEQPGAATQIEEEIDPYSFLDIKHIETAIPIKLHEDSPIIGPRLNQPQIQVQISDLQRTIDSAIGTVIDKNKQQQQQQLLFNNNKLPNQPSKMIYDQSKSKSIESNDSNNNNDNNNNNNNILPLMLDEKYCKHSSVEITEENNKKKNNQKKNNENINISDDTDTDSDDFQIVD